MSMLTYPVLMLSTNLYLAPAMTTVDQRFMILEGRTCGMLIERRSNCTGHFFSEI
uniref:Uncharacterized protein n=1 Tax=Setaria italica TaxID=4555 RepID=K3ZFW3_SETIT